MICYRNGYNYICYTTHIGSKTEHRRIADYINAVIARIYKNKKPLYRDEYASIALKLAVRFCGAYTNSCLKALCVDDCGKPLSTCGYGRFLKDGTFEVRYGDEWWYVSEAEDAPFCLISKKQSCMYCKKYLHKERFSCSECYKISVKIQKDELEAKELRKLTQQLKRLCNEKI